MLTKQQQQEVLETLNEVFDVQDVHFHKDKLYVVNAYDLPAVQDFMETTAHYFLVQLAEEELYA